MKSFKNCVQVILLIALPPILLLGFACLVINNSAHKNNNPIGADLTNGWYYALTAKVVEIDTTNDVVTCEDCNGNFWGFRGTEDWEIGDCASLLIESHGTNKITDDTIRDAKFSAWELTR